MENNANTDTIKNNCFWRFGLMFSVSIHSAHFFFPQGFCNTDIIFKPITTIQSKKKISLQVFRKYLKYFSFKGKILFFKSSPIEFPEYTALWELLCKILQLNTKPNYYFRCLLRTKISSVVLSFRAHIDIIFCLLCVLTMTHLDADLGHWSLVFQQL